MNFEHRFNTVDFPVVPLLSSLSLPDLPIGQFVSPAPYEPHPEDIQHMVAGKIDIRDLYLPRVTVRSFKGEFIKDVLLYNKRGIGENYIGSCFFIEGRLTSFLNGHDHGTNIIKGMSNLKFDPNNDYGHLCPASQPLEIIHFGMRIDFFLEILPKHERWADELRAKVTRKERILPERGTPITADQYKALQNIIDCQVAGPLRQMLMETYVAQIILLQLHGLFEKHEPLTRYSKRDLELIHSVRNYLSTNFLDDHSLTSLARNFGVNTNKLMSLFKAQFSVSIFDFIGTLKMEHAKQLLQDGLSVAAVGSAVGYKNPHHFSVAFKKRYGVIPSQIRVAA